MANTISVWLQLKNGDNQGKWILQRRSEQNAHFPYVCQPTWAGKVEEGESIEDALLRECREELGDQFADQFNAGTLVLVKKTHYARDEKMWEVFNYVGQVDEELLAKAVLSQESLPEFVIVNPTDEMYPLNLGRDPKEHIVLFDDQFTVFHELSKNSKRHAH